MTSREILGYMRPMDENEMIPFSDNLIVVKCITYDIPAQYNWLVSRKFKLL